MNISSRRKKNRQHFQDKNISSLRDKCLQSMEWSGHRNPGLPLGILKEKNLIQTGQGK